MATRPNEFSESTKREARLRQWGVCALCGDSLDDEWEHARHLMPIMLGRKPDVANCVALCEDCHDGAHYNGNFSSGVVAPAVANLPPMASASESLTLYTVVAFQSSCIVMPPSSQVQVILRYVIEQSSKCE